MKSLDEIKKKIAAAAKKLERDPGDIKLIAVSKGVPIQKMEEALQAGLGAFGENYAQELLKKSVCFESPTKIIEWHFLGHLQRNKVGKIIDTIDWLHSLDSLPLAQMIETKAKKSLPSLLEIKLGAEETKSGLSPFDALKLVPELNGLNKIDLRGLMTIPPQSLDPENSRPLFKELAQLLREISRRSLYKKPLTELSMGMSFDFEIAIEEGATMVRIGRGIFGERG